MSAGSIARLASFVALLASADALATGPTFNVNTSGDAKDAAINGTCDTGGGVCSLRAAVMEANATSGALIAIPAGTYMLSVTPTGADDASTGDLNVTSAMTIQGAGVGVTILEAATLGDSVFRVENGGTLDVSGVTIQNATGHVDTFSDFGGAFYVVAGGALHVSDARIYKSQLAGSDDGYGGALYLEGGTATFTRTVIDSCSVGGMTFSGGGAIYNGNGSLTLDRCTVTSCKITAGYGIGGAIWNAGAAASTRIEASTLTNNMALVGGAIEMYAGTCVLVNSTVSGNMAVADGGAIDVGVNGQVHLYNTTVINNRCDTQAVGSGHGGGVWSASAASFSLQNSVLAYNLGTNPQHAVVNEDCYGTVSANARNVLTTQTNCTVVGAGGSFTVGDPFLAADLADNGGPTQTHAVADGGGGAAVDHGDLGCTDDLAAAITTDQRGVHRPIGPACDLGSFELEPIGDANGDGHVDVADVFYLINDLFAAGPIPLGRGDVNNSSSIDVSDVFYLVNFLFAGGPAPV